jgi:nucleotide-binding universal stress UspA family protein
MERVLFPTDFSDNSLKAFPYALDIALLLGAELTLFNAYKLPYSKSNLLVSMTDRMKKDSEDELAKLKKQSLAQEKYSTLKINVEARSGGFVSQIPKVAKMDNSDIIVMGTKGADGLKEMFIGSNTLEVIQITHCPVLAIPEKAQNTKVDKIAMATDLKKIQDPIQLAPLFDMARICKASIEFVNIIRPQDDNNEEERAKQASLLMDMADDIPTSIHFATNSDIIAGLSDYVTDNHPDMLAMLSRKHSLFERLFLQSITSKLSFRSEIPLLVLDE